MKNKRKKVYDKTVSIKTAKEYGTKHANKLLTFDNNIMIMNIINKIMFLNYKKL